MFGVIAKLENDERLTPEDWEILIAHEFNVSKQAAISYVKILYYVRNYAEIRRNDGMEVEK